MNYCMREGSIMVLSLSLLLIDSREPPPWSTARLCNETFDVLKLGGFDSCMYMCSSIQILTIRL